MTERGKAGWIILRTDEVKTIRLARSLSADGFDVWTPTRVERRRRREVEVPLVGRFVFARVHHLDALLAIAALPERSRRGAGCREAAYPEFKVFRKDDSERIPVVDDAELDPLRHAESRVAIHRPRRYQQGDRVEMPSGAWEGLAGEVVKSSRRWTIVSLGNGFEVSVATFILKPRREIAVAA